MKSETRYQKCRKYQKNCKTKSARRFIRRLTRKGSKKQRGGNQALVAAAQVGNLVTVNQLLEAGAHPNGQNPDNPGAFVGWDQDPLVIAARNGHLNIVQRLLQAGAEVNFQGSGYAVFWATQRGHLDILEVLLQQPNVNVNIVASLGDTPLSIAVEYHNIPAIQLLLTAGADPHLQNLSMEIGEGFQSYSALQEAQQRGFQDIVQILEGQPIASPSPRTNLNVPEGSENTIYYVPIEEGDELVDFHDEARFGRYYKQSTFNGPPRMIQNPATRVSIRPQNITYHVARIVPGAVQPQNHAS